MIPVDAIAGFGVVLLAVVVAAGRAGRTKSYDPPVVQSIERTPDDDDTTSDVRDVLRTARAAHSARSLARPSELVVEPPSAGVVATLAPRAKLHRQHPRSALPILEPAAPLSPRTPLR